MYFFIYLQIPTDLRTLSARISGKKLTQLFAEKTCRLINLLSAGWPTYWRQNLCVLAALRELLFLNVRYGIWFFSFLAKTQRGIWSKSPQLCEKCLLTCNWSTCRRQNLCVLASLRELFFFKTSSEAEEYLTSWWCSAGARLPFSFASSY